MTLAEIAMTLSTQTDLDERTVEDVIASLTPEERAFWEQLAPVILDADGLVEFAPQNAAWSR